MQKTNKCDLRLLEHSDLFDSGWYLSRYPDVGMARMDPLEHYLWLGAKLRRNPSEKFDSSYYLQVNPDVAESGVNPLLHYLKVGRREGRPIKAVPDRWQSLGEESNLPVIVYDGNNLKIQGAQNSLFEMALGIKRRGKFSSVLATSELGPLSESYTRNGIRCAVHGIFPDDLANVELRDRYIRALANYYSSLGASIVHVNTLQNFHSVIAARFAGVPVIWNVRESENPDTYYDYLKGDLRDLAYSCFSMASLMVFVSEATRRHWMERFNGVVESITIHNGIDVDRIRGRVYNINRPLVRERLGIVADDIVILNVGTVSERKGQHDLIDAMENLSFGSLQRVVLAFVGINNSEYSKSVKRRLNALAEERGLRYIAIEESGSESDQSQVAELYLASDVFVLSSRIESYPRVILEAMEFALPIISTPCFGVCEQLINGESGLFYSAGDGKGLASLIEYFVEGPDERKKFSKAARERLGSLNSYEGMLQEYEGLYMQLIDRTT